MKSRILLLFVLGIGLNSMVWAQDDAVSSDTPWAKGAEHMPLVPAEPAPLMDMTISGSDESPIPAEVSEDVPIVVNANSRIFFDEAPNRAPDGYEYLNAEWLEEPTPLWYFHDWTNNSAFLASTSEEIAGDQMVIIPTTPTENGAITCHCSRRMQYTADDGSTKTCFANSSAASRMKVLDITPPSCGLEITIENGGSGKCWPVENPPDQYPLPKQADMCFSGVLFDAPDDLKYFDGYVLGENMIVSEEHAVIKLKNTDVIRLKVIGNDNLKLNFDKLKFGVCAGAGGEPTPVTETNQELIDFSKFAIPEKPYLFVDATDTTGNRQVLFIPIEVQ